MVCANPELELTNLSSLVSGSEMQKYTIPTLISPSLQLFTASLSSTNSRSDEAPPR